MPNSPPATSLLRVLGLFFGIAVSIGCTLGVGILRQPGPVASYLREPWLIMLMWLAGAVYSLLGVLNVAELSTMVPKAGGFYVFAREAMGDTAGFAVGWSDFLANVAAAAYAAMAAVEFLARVVPSIADYGIWVGTGFILAFAAIQWFGIRISGRVQQVASAIAATALLALVLACLSIPAGPALPAPPPQVNGFLAALVLAIQSIVVTYDGWYEPIYFAEETHRPVQHIPRAMFGGLALVTTIYLLLNYAFLRALGPAGLAASKFAAADAAKLIFGRGSDVLLSAVAVVILLTLLHVVLMTGTRILFAVSRDGLFWGRAARSAQRDATDRARDCGLRGDFSGTQRHRRPAHCYGGILLRCQLLLVLRLSDGAAFQEARVERPFRVPAYPLPTLLALTASLAFLTGAVVSDRTNSLYALLLLAASYPARLLVRR